MYSLMYIHHENFIDAIKSHAIIADDFDELNFTFVWFKICNATHQIDPREMLNVLLYSMYG